MTWTYANAPATGSTQGRRDAVRVLIPDITGTVQLVTDEVIKFWLDQSANNIYRAAAHICRSLADANTGTAMSVGDLSISGGSETWTKKAMSYDRRADYSATPFAGGISIDSKQTYESDTDRVEPAFTRTQDDIPGGPGVRGSTSST